MYEMTIESKAVSRYLSQYQQGKSGAHIDAPLCPAYQPKTDVVSNGKRVYLSVTYFGKVPLCTVLDNPMM